jgi:hypothetical protein
MAIYTKPLHRRRDTVLVEGVLYRKRKSANSGYPKE